MIVLKFGGASVKDANGVRNLKKVLETVGYKNTILVISAMGKMTNAFEQLVETHLIDNNAENFDLIKDFHENIVNNLFKNKAHFVYKEVQDLLEDLNGFLMDNNSSDYNYVYDQIVGYGELLSSTICSAYLHKNGIENTWLDIRKCIKTNDDFRRAKVDWETTRKLLNNKINHSELTITQGFIASDNYGKTTTLGREGSDYTAAIIAHCVNAKEVNIFKDVEGILNADPRWFDKTILLNQISYREAIEMAFYGASVIHPKTLQPLQRKEIPLYVKSFINPLKKGTSISKGIDLEPKTSCFVVKKNQILLSISDKEFHFVMESDISKIFNYLHQLKLKVNLIQNSAISFTVCVEDNFNNFDELIEIVQLKYKVLYNTGLTLYTIRHFTDTAIQKIEKNKKVLLKQLSRETAQIVVKDKI